MNLYKAVKRVIRPYASPFLFLFLCFARVQHRLYHPRLTFLPGYTLFLFGGPSTARFFLRRR